ncbi:UNVERIFIED_CONTAM: hypothetical protein RMT77_006302 [Armadillidium vulgare]
MDKTLSMNENFNTGHENDWTSFTLTHVEYLRGDNLGQFLAIISLYPISLIISFITLILFRRDIHTITFFIGILVCEGINLILKNIIAEPRPFLRTTLYTEYGMPSSHSQMSWFFTVYSIFFILLRLRHNHCCAVENLWKTVVIVGLSCVASMVTYSRVYLLYHTWSQVLVGSIVGIIFGCIWFALTHYLFAPLFPVIASWNVCEFLMIRDTSLIPNILWFEYTQARSETRSRNRKLVLLKKSQ